MSFTSLVRFILRYFILSDAIINGIVFLISLSDSSLLAYRNATDFCILISYPATLLNSFISSNRVFLVASLGFSYIVSFNLQTVIALLLPFQFGFLFFIFSHLIAVARTSNSMLNKSRGVGILVLFLILEEVLSAFHC